jgi:hypothetical protein
MKHGHVSGRKRERKGATDWYRDIESGHIAHIEASERKLHMARTSKTSTTSTDIATQTAEDHIARLEVIEQKLRAPIPTTEATTMGEKAPCSQCGAEVARKSLRKGTCRKCVRSNLDKLHGEQANTDMAQEPTDVHVEPELQAEPTVMAINPVEQAAPAVEDAPAAPAESNVEISPTATRLRAQELPRRLILASPSLSTWLPRGLTLSPRLYAATRLWSISPRRRRPRS